MSELALDVAGLHKHFGSTQVLRGIDLRVNRNSIYGFLGPNGAGKSTTMKILMGLLRPSDGHAEVFGRDVTTDGPGARTLIGYLPQHPRFHPRRTCRQIVSYVASLYPGGGGGRRDVRRRVDDLLGQVGLSDLAKRRTANLSGGESQRLGLAQALVPRPDLLVLDEPAAALDPQGRRDVLEIIEGLRDEVTVFYSTHILDDVQRVSDSVAILSGGRIVADGPLDELLSGDTSAWTLRVSGRTGDARGRVASQPWVTDVLARARGESEVWTVHVTSDDAAADRLLPLVLDDGCDVAEFHRSDRTLEAAYLAIVGHDREG